VQASLKLVLEPRDRLGDRRHSGRVPPLLHRGIRFGDRAADLALGGNAQAKISTFTGPSVLVIDELGYLPMDATSAHCIPGGLAPLRARLDCVEVQPWPLRLGALFADQVIAAAFLDRPLHHATVINIKGKSYRMRRHADALDTTKERSMLRSGHALFVIRSLRFS
jgi:IstB-like ATP binding protein